MRPINQYGEFIVTVPHRINYMPIGFTVTIIAS